jgi:hypothetical protein
MTKQLFLNNILTIFLLVTSSSYDVAHSLALSSTSSSSRIRGLSRTKATKPVVGFGGCDVIGKKRSVSVPRPYYQPALTTSTTTTTTSLEMSSSSGTNNNPTTKKKKKKKKRTPLAVRILGNMFYALTAPFPDLRKLLQSRGSLSDDDDDDDPTNNLVLPLRTALLAVTIYLSIGVLSYHVLFEKWSIVDAIYFSCVCFSTVGYGTCIFFFFFLFLIY